MHYQNGRPARLGDIVRGKGYNVKHEIIGLLIEADQEKDSCNCTVACVAATEHWPALMSVRAMFDNEGKIKAIDTLPFVEATREYGQLDAFVALDPITGDVLS